MKKKLSILLCAFAILFAASCTDLAVDDESAVKANLPSDFDWKTYAKINKDVASSQIIFDVKEKNKAFSGPDSAKKAISNCFALLKNPTLAEKVYLDLAACPRDAWNRDAKCPGIYAYNTTYNKPTVNANGDTTGWQCIFGNTVNSEVCWQSGWDSLKDSLLTYLETTPTTISFAPVKTMCLFIPPATDANEVMSYLDFNLDSALVMEHYFYMGLYDGRPYKYCNGQHDVEKTLSLADKRGTYYDYGRYTFCLEENDQKIYVVK